MTSLHTPEAPAPAPSTGAGAKGFGLHPFADEVCTECHMPIGRHEYVRAVVIGPASRARLLGFVHVEVCSQRIATKCSTFSEYRAVNARLVDLG